MLWTSLMFCFDSRTALLNTGCALAVLKVVNMVCWNDEISENSQNFEKTESRWN